MNSQEAKSPEEEYVGWKAPETGQRPIEVSPKDQSLSSRLVALQGFRATGDFRRDGEEFLRTVGFAKKVPDLQSGGLNLQSYLESIRKVNQDYLDNPRKGSDEYDSGEGQQSWLRLLKRQNEIIDEILGMRQQASTGPKSIYEPGTDDYQTLGMMSRETGKGIQTQIADLERRAAENPDDQELQKRLNLLRRLV